MSGIANPKKISSPQYESLVAELLSTYPDLETGSLFGMPSLKQDGKALLGSFDGGVVFKLHGADHAAALALDGSVLFDPSGKGRPMKDWVVVGPIHEASWSTFAAKSLGR